MIGIWNLPATPATTVAAAAENRWSRPRRRRRQGRRRPDRRRRTRPVWFGRRNCCRPANRWPPTGTRPQQSDRRATSTSADPWRVSADCMRCERRARSSVCACRTVSPVRRDVRIRARLWPWRRRGYTAIKINTRAPRLVCAPESAARRTAETGLRPLNNITLHDLLPLFLFCRKSVRLDTLKIKTPLKRHKSQ